MFIIKYNASSLLAPDQYEYTYRNRIIIIVLWLKSKKIFGPRFVFYTKIYNCVRHKFIIIIFIGIMNFNNVNHLGFSEKNDKF